MPTTAVPHWELGTGYWELAVIGTLINVAAVVAGGTAGTLLGNRLPDRVRDTVLRGLGLVVLVIGVQGAIGTRNVLIVLLSVVVGGILGELAGIEDRLESVAGWLERRIGSGDSARFIRGFVTASLVFCVGPLTILGSIQDGLTGDYRTLAVKSALDGFAAIAFASSLGVGVVASALFVLLYQGALTLLAAGAKALLTDAAIVEMSATGGVLILGIGLKLLEVAEIRVANFLPAILLAPAAVILFNLS